MEKKRLQGARGERGPRRGDAAFESFGDPGSCGRPKPSPRGLLCSPPAPGTRVGRKTPLEGLLVPTPQVQQRRH